MVVLSQVPVGVFQGCLGFANATQAAQCRPTLCGECLLQFRQHPLPTGKERVLFRKIRKRHFFARHAWRICLRRAYWGFAAASIFLQTAAKTAFRLASVKLSNGFEISCVAW